MDKEKFAQRFKQLRENLDIKQKELAAVLGVKRSTVGSWESAHRLPEIEKVYKAAEIFNVPSDYLLGLTDDPKLPQTTDQEVIKEIEEAKKETKKMIDEAFERIAKIMEKHAIKQDNGPM